MVTMGRSFFIRPSLAEDLVDGPLRVGLLELAPVLRGHLVGQTGLGQVEGLDVGLAIPSAANCATVPEGSAGSSRRSSEELAAFGLELNDETLGRRRRHRSGAGSAPTPLSVARD
jgi:hypothetical protein